MKRKKMNVILSSLALIAALLAELYCFLEFRGDVLTILGTAAVVLVTAFLTLDSVLSMAGGHREYGGNGLPEGDLEQIVKHMESLDQAEKESLVLVKKALQRQQRQQELMQKVLGGMAQQNATIVKAAKLLAKCNREDARVLGGILKERPQEINISELIQTVNAGFDTMDQRLAALIETIKELPVSEGEFSTGAFDDIVDEMAGDAVPEEKPAAEETELDLTALEDVLPKEGLLEDTPQEDILPAQDAPELETSQPEAPAAEAPAPDLSDPNKMMSPDDIAALLASMGQ